MQISLEPISWSDYLESKELSDLMKTYRHISKLIDVINEMHPEGFLIQGVKLVDFDDMYHTEKFYTRSMLCIFKNSHLDKYNIKCRYDLFKELTAHTYYDCVVSLNSDKNTQFIMKAFDKSSFWIKTEDGLHMKLL